MSIIRLQHADIYQKDFLVLENVNFKLAAGEFSYLIELPVVENLAYSRHCMQIYHFKKEKEKL